MNLRRGSLTAVLVTIVALFCLPAVASAAETGSWTFEYGNGVPQTFVVPPGVTKLSILAIGGAGAPASSAFDGGPGGTSGTTYGRFAVTPGETLTIWVGQEGLAKTGSEGVSLGYGCGGPAGHGHGSLIGHASADGGGGGGASAVARGDFSEEEACPDEASESSESAEAHLLVVAGGGGGGGEGSLYVSGVGQGGPGGDGGHPAGGEAGTKGCGGCRPGPSGEGGEDGILLNGGAGGGGGGYRGGGGGGSGPGGAQGGGGGESFIASSALESAYLPGHGTGDGIVTITSLESEAFTCTGHTEEVTAPAGATVMEVEATGGAGAGADPTQPEITGGTGGTAAGTFEVAEDEKLEVSVGCQGEESSGGWGFGTGGAGGEKSESAKDGDGGGGSSAVARHGGSPLVVAGGGGGAGGRGGPEQSGNPGGKGGAGGDPAANGEGGDEGELEYGGHGGEGGAIAGPNGERGGEGADFSEEGGGGGGGAGWFGGRGGASGHAVTFGKGSGGGGGGGGLSHVAEGAVNPSVGTGSLTGGGLVTLTYRDTGPALIAVDGGSAQSTEVGREFAAPLVARIVDVAAEPVAGAEVTFTLPASGASGTFLEGVTTETVTTNAEGIATSSYITANGVGGPWQATASVPHVAAPATFALSNSGSPTSVKVTPSDDPVATTEPVTFTAEVSSGDLVTGTPTGFVQFYEGETAIGTPVELSGGVATSVPVTGLSVGTHTIEARYEPTVSFQASAGSGTVRIEKAGTATSVTASRNPVLAGESVQFTANISVPSTSSPYEGEVQFVVEGVPLGAPVQASGGVAISPSFEPTTQGARLVIAEVAETADFEASQGQVLLQTEADAIGVEVSSSANPVEYGAPFSLTADVSPAPPVTIAPEGNVLFSGGGAACQETLDESKATCEPLPPLPPGSQEFTANYSGDANYAASSGTMIEQIVKAKSLTTVGATPSPVTYGEEVALTAEVGRRTTGEGTPTGTVEFALDGKPQAAPVTLSGGRAETTVAKPAAGAYVVSAEYSGDADFTAGEGGAPYLVLPDPTDVTLAASAEGTQPGAGVTFTADVAAPKLPNGEAAPTPTGKVQFRVDGLDFGAPVALNAGQATSKSDAALDPGRHRVVALYLPADGNFLPSAASLGHVVQEQTSTVLASTANPSASGADVTVRAHTGPAAAEGTLSFAVDGTPVPTCQSLTPHEGEASCTLSGLAAGAHEVSASFSGSTLLDPSRAAMTQTVEAVPPKDDSKSNSSPGSSAPGAPAPTCRPGSVSARAIVFGSKPMVQLAARYRGLAPKSKVTVALFARTAKGSKGKRLATAKRTWRAQGVARLNFRLPARTMAELRRARHGLVAVVTAPGASGVCALGAELALKSRRAAHGRIVWAEAR
jgi:hypothetical protein